MSRLVLVMLSFVITSSGLVYIERYTAKSTEIAVWTVNYTHDLAGHSITNGTVQTLITLTKALLYVTIKAAENKNDRQYKNTLVKTVADAEKTLKNMQSNLILKSFLANIMRAMDFEPKFPLLPGSYRFINVTFNTSFVSHILPETRTMVEFKFTGVKAGTLKSQPMGGVTFYGGFRRN